MRDSFFILLFVSLIQAAAFAQYPARSPEERRADKKDKSCALSYAKKSGYISSIANPNSVTAIPFSPAGDVNYLLEAYDLVMNSPKESEEKEKDFNLFLVMFEKYAMSTVLQDASVHSNNVFLDLAKAIQFYGQDPASIESLEFQKSLKSIVSQACSVDEKAISLINMATLIRLTMINERLCDPAGPDIETKIPGTIFTYVEKQDPVVVNSYESVLQRVKETMGKVESKSFCEALDLVNDVAVLYGQSVHGANRANEDIGQTLAPEGSPLIPAGTR